MKYIEDENIELKRVLNDTFEKEVVAFLNTNDGVIYIGIEDDGNICGVEINKLDYTMKKIADIIANSIRPNPQALINVSTKYEDEKFIVQVEIKKGNALYYINKYGRSSKGCYIRVGTSCISMTEEQIEKAYISYIVLPETKMKDMPVLRKDCTFFKFKSYLLSNSIRYKEENFLENFNLITSDGKYNILADLLSDDNMTSIKIAVFKGNDKSKFIKRNEYGNTCLIYAIKQVLNYCEALNDTYVDLSVSPRQEKKMFNFEAVKEAWINACVHNRWVDGMPPAIYWYEDRIEIMSYGGIPRGLTKEQFLSGKTKPVNKELMDILLQCKIVDQSGHGVPTIVDIYGEEVYTFSENFISVTIPFYKAINSLDINKVENDVINDVINLVTVGNDGINDGLNLETGENDEINDVINSVTGENDEINDGINLVTVGNDGINDGLNLETGENDGINDGINLETCENDRINDGINLETGENDEINDVINSVTGENDVINDGINLVTVGNDGINDGLNLETGENDKINDVINSVTGENDEINDGIKLKNNEILVLHYIEINPKATILELSDNLSKSIKTVERIVLILKEKGFIKRVGSKKNGYWKIMK